MEIIMGWLEGQLVKVAIGGVCLLVIALVLFVINSVKLQKLMRRYRQLMRGSTGANLEQLIEDSLRELSVISSRQIKIEAQLAVLEARTQVSLQGVGMVRFDAFRDSGGEQSFSLGIADRRGDGFVLTNLHGRDESYLYAKPLRGWHSSYPLTEEEEEAIREAFQGIEEEKAGIIESRQEKTD